MFRLITYKFRAKVRVYGIVRSIFRKYFQDLHILYYMVCRSLLSRHSFKCQPPCVASCNIRVSVFYGGIISQCSCLFYTTA